MKIIIKTILGYVVIAGILGGPFIYGYIFAVLNGSMLVSVTDKKIQNVYSENDQNIFEISYKLKNNTGSEVVAFIEVRLGRNMLAGKGKSGRWRVRFMPYKSEDVERIFAPHAEQMMQTKMSLAKEDPRDFSAASEVIPDILVKKVRKV